jgi:hypothetical protein
MMYLQSGFTDSKPIVKILTERYYDCKDVHNQLFFNHLKCVFIEGGICTMEAEMNFRLAICYFLFWAF